MKLILDHDDNYTPRFGVSFKVLRSLGCWFIVDLWRHWFCVGLDWEKP